jgi:hypothetical protein
VDDLDFQARLREESRACGEAALRLRVGNRRVRVEGLPPDLLQALVRRWGGFVEADGPDEPWCTLRTVPHDDSYRLLEPRPGEPYRIEARNDPERRLLVSYSFALTPSESPRRWNVALRGSGAEPLDRVLENVLRYLVARMALELGGFAMHAGGILRDGRAWLFAGKSRAGKSTAIELSAPATGLGDDFAAIWPGRRGWITAALPFENSERADADPPRGVWPVAGIWKLFQADAHAVEKPAAARSVASLMSCAAFPWALPELSDVLLKQVTAASAAGLLGHLRFRRDSGFWSLL